MGVRSVHCLAVAAAALALLPTVTAHEGATNHITFIEGTLEPGEEQRHELEFLHEPLAAGWIFLLSIQTEPAALDARLLWNGTVAAQWPVAPVETRVLSARLPETGYYTVAFRNTGTATTRYGFFFDQSCNCFGKIIPGNLTGSVVVFNIDLDPGIAAEATLQDPRALDTRVDLAVERAGGEGEWPRGFEILASSAGREVHRFNVSSDRSARYYFFTTVLARYPELYLSPEDGLIVPDFVVTGAGRGGSGEPPCEELPSGCKRSPAGLELAAIAIASAAVTAFRQRER